MSPLPVIADTAVIVGLAMLVVAALHDVMARTVPNGVALIIAAAGLVAQISQSLMGAGHLLVALPVAFSVFIAAGLLWRRGLMGGADVKLFAASSLLMPPMLVPSMLVSITIAGGLLALVYLLARRRLPRPEPGRPPGLFARVVRLERWRLRRGGPLPYAVAIASGVVFVVSRGGILS